MNASETLKRVIAALHESGIPYMLTGSFASAHYGTPRSTLDLDLVIAPESEQLRNFVGLLSNDHLSKISTTLSWNPPSKPIAAARCST